MISNDEYKKRFDEVSNQLNGMNLDEVKVFLYNIKKQFEESVTSKKG